MNVFPRAGELWSFRGPQEPWQDRTYLILGRVIYSVLITDLQDRVRVHHLYEDCFRAPDDFNLTRIP